MRIDNIKLQDRENLIGAISAIFLYIQVLAQPRKNDSDHELNQHLNAIEDHVLKLNLRLSHDKNGKRPG